MKKLFSIIALAALLIGCTLSNQDKGEKLIKEYLTENLNDPSSYESVSFGTIDSTLSILEEEPETKLLEQAKAHQRLAKTFQHTAVYGDTEAEREEAKKNFYKNLQQSDSLLKIVSEFTSNYKPYFNGYKLSHKYRAKNKLGALGLEESVFYFDKEMTKVVKVK